MRSLRDYCVVTGAYWGFTVTDGALRMLVLLYLHSLGTYSPVEIASLFLFYELFGVVTNLVGGWLGARIGLTKTLFAGLALQIVAVGALTVPPEFLSVPFVMGAQGLSGVAKDLTKMSSKSYIKLVVPKGDASRLMKWVSVLTGSKNTLKGVGFFAGAALLSLVGFRAACGGMAVALVIPLVVSLVMLPPAAGQAKRKAPFKSVFSKDPRINWLSATRCFLFGSRDVWFVLALPIFLGDVLGWSFSQVGAFLALWVIGYGFVQAAAPRYVGARPSASGAPREAPTAARLSHWTAALVLPLGGILAGLALGAPPTITLIAGLAIFGFVFATNSAIHSYLVVHYAEEDGVSLAVGFYYMCNALGRLLGTILSGVVFQAAGMGQSGLMACIATSLALVVLSRVLCGPLRSAEARAGATAA